MDEVVTVPPVVEMDNETLRKHLEKRHAHPWSPVTADRSENIVSHSRTHPQKDHGHRELAPEVVLRSLAEYRAGRTDPPDYLELYTVAERLGLDVDEVWAVVVEAALRAL